MIVLKSENLIKNREVCPRSFHRKYFIVEISLISFQKNYEERKTKRRETRIRDGLPPTGVSDYAFEGRGGLSDVAREREREADRERRRRSRSRDRDRHHRRRSRSRSRDRHRHRRHHRRRSRSRSRSRDRRRSRSRSRERR